MNRTQNHLKLLLANSLDGSTKTLYEEKNPYYIDINSDLTFLQDGKHFLFTSEKDGNNHIYLYDMNGNMEAQITEGRFDVDQIVGINEKTEQIYFTAAVTSPMDR